MCIKVAREGAETTGYGSEFQWDTAWGTKSKKKSISMCKGQVQCKRCGCIRSSGLMYNNIRWEISQLVHSFVKRMFTV